MPIYSRAVYHRQWKSELQNTQENLLHFNRRSFFDEFWLAAAPSVRTNNLCRIINIKRLVYNYLEITTNADIFSGQQWKRDVILYMGESHAKPYRAAAAPADDACLATHARRLGDRPARLQRPHWPDADATTFTTAAPHRRVYHV